eukprot:jgi/Chlat1/5870/Chrsp4S06374
MDAEVVRRVAGNLGRLSACSLLLAVLLWDLSVRPAGSTIFVATRDNATFSFVDADAAFGAPVPLEGIQGILLEALPNDACSPLTPPPAAALDPSLPWFALIVRGQCPFETKVLNAQLAGAAAAIVYNDERTRELITMSARRATDIRIPAVFVENRSGLELLYLSSIPGTVTYIQPDDDAAAWSVMAVSFIGLLCVSAVLATFFFVRRNRWRRGAGGLLDTSSSDSLGMSASEVKALPSIIYRTGSLTSAGMETCAICLEEYADGDKLRVLPCKHEYHTSCIDVWLISRRPSCPKCKRTVNSSASPEAETAPLLRSQFTPAGPEPPPQRAAPAPAAANTGTVTSVDAAVNTDADDMC